MIFRMLKYPLGSNAQGVFYDLFRTKPTNAIENNVSIVYQMSL